MIGVMSGSSMDGVDLAYCMFTHENGRWHFKIEQAETVSYPERWINRLTHLHEQPVFLYPKTDMFYGRYLGELINAFIQKHHIEVDLIASHGHTIFHQPENGFTAQIGNGAAIHAETGLPVVSDFRTVDVALGGQGAPLVPVGDRDLFYAYDACLNLGGFANISFMQHTPASAFDISPCNVLLNQVAGWLGHPYDDGGKLAASGNVNMQLLAMLDALEFYQQHRAKSLGIEWVNEHIWPVVKQHEPIDAHDLLATFSAHIAGQIAQVINRAAATQVLVTGGGALNDHLLDTIRTHSSATLTVPDLQLLQYKEALIFAYLGVLRITNNNNALKSVTGAARNNTGGALFGHIPRLHS